jgi:hypothetical protein
MEVRLANDFSARSADIVPMQVWPVIDIRIRFVERRDGTGGAAASACGVPGHGVRARRLPLAKPSAEVAGERIDPDALERLSVAMQPIELTAPLSVAEAQPVGGLVACR